MNRSLLCAALALAGCTLTPRGDSDGGSDADEYVYDAPIACPDPGGLAFRVPQQPNVMLLVDRSGSMDNTGACSDPPCGSRWEQLLALTPILDDLEKASRLGLTVFPAPDDGCDGGILVPLSAEDDADEAVATALAGSGPGGSTPMVGALGKVARDGHIHDPYRDNVVVLLTDGVPSCECGSGCDSAAATQSVRELTGGDVPVELFIIGFGVSDEASTLLSEMADAAKATTNGENYFEADSVEELYDRVYRIAASLDACTFELEEEVAAEDLLVYASGAEIPPCVDTACMDGYVYDAASGIVKLAPLACRDLGGAECPDIHFERR